MSAVLQPHATQTLPYLIEPEQPGCETLDDLVQLIERDRTALAQLLNVHGGVLFRGFTVDSEEAFGVIGRTLIPSLQPYVEGQSPRTKIGDNVYTSTEFPAAYRITLHNELSYKKTAPRHIVFNCHQSAETGGETPILDCRTAYKAIPSDIREKFETHGVRYLKTMHGQEHGLGKSWMAHFETSDRAQVEEYLVANDLEFGWTPEGNLRTAAVRPATIIHPETGEMIWFNQANLWHITNVDERRRQQIIRRCGMDNLPTHATYGDGSPIEDSDINLVRNILWENSIIKPWQEGDVLFLDNLLVAHGRNSFTGSRKTLVVMG